jgi:tetratricopeptide (TPR) repeat protein
MNRSLRPLATALLATLLAFPAVAQDWSGKGRVNGVVTDESGKPLEGATIRLRHEKIPDNGPADLKTDKKGKWSYLGLLGGPWTVRVVAEGYVPSEGVVNVNEFAPNPLISLKLRKPTAQEAEAGGDPKMKEAQAQIDKGDALLQQKNAAGARAEYEKALPLLEGANRRIVMKRIATCQMLEGDDAAAVDTLKAVLAEAPDDADALRLIVDRLIVLKRDAEAQEYMAKMPQGASGVDPNTILNMGINLYNENKLAEAVAKFEQVVSLKPDWADGYYYRGLANLAQGKGDLAKADFQKVLELDPNHQYANDCREFLKSL